MECLPGIVQSIDDLKLGYWFSCRKPSSLDSLTAHSLTLSDERSTLHINQATAHIVSLAPKTHHNLRQLKSWHICSHRSVTSNAMPGPNIFLCHFQNGRAQTAGPKPVNASSSSHFKLHCSVSQQCHCHLLSIRSSQICYLPSANSGQVCQDDPSHSLGHPYLPQGLFC